MVRILVIDNNIDPPPGCADIVQCLEQAGGPQAEVSVTVKRGPEQQIGKEHSDWDAVVVSGSKTEILDNAPWISAQMEFLKSLYRDRKPVLGICYGEQLLIRALGGDEYVRRTEHGEFGFTEISCTEEARQSPLFRGMDSKFYSYSYHFDEAHKLPDGFLLMAKSDLCSVQAFERQDAPLWGIQFHPEKTLEQAKESVQNLKSKPKEVRILNEERMQEVYDPKVAQILFGNFLKQIQELEE